MLDKKIFIIFCILALNSCGPSSTALFAPAYTFTSTGSIMQTGLSYSSNEMITKYTGKTPIENLKTIAKPNPKKNNIMKETLESEEFYILVKNKIKITGDIIKSSNQ
jgi:hypothetical protein